MSAEWKRPASLPFPNVWHRCKGLRPMPDGRVPNFWIQDVPPELDETIVDFMCEGYLVEANTLRMMKIREDPVSYESIRKNWHNVLQQRVAIVAFSDWPNGEKSPTIAGCNVTAVDVKGHNFPKLPGEALQKWKVAMAHIENHVDIFERYGVDAFMTSFGLSVLPQFRGNDLGRGLLVARDLLTRAVGLKVTSDTFGVVASQKQAASVGYELLYDLKYKEYRQDGEHVFPDPSCESIQLMAKYLA